MLSNHPDDQKLDKNIVLAAIKAVKAKGWDLNPFTVADELGIPHPMLYRDSEAMGLILHARGDSLGMIPDASLNVVREIQELKQQNIELQDNLRRLEQQKGPGRQAYLDVKDEFAERELMAPRENEPRHGEANSPSTQIQSQELPQNGQDGDLYNAARITPTDSDFNPLASLTWKDIETVYHMKVTTLREYARNIPGPTEPGDRNWFSENNEPAYRPYLSDNLATAAQPTALRAEPQEIPTKPDVAPKPEVVTRPAETNRVPGLFVEPETQTRPEPQTMRTVSSDSLPKVSAKDKLPEVEDSSASPFQKLKTSSSWPRPELLEPLMPPKEEAVNIIDNPPSPSEEAPPVKHVVEGMPWGQFADTLEGNAAPAVPGQSPPEGVKQKFSETLPTLPTVSPPAKGTMQPSVWEHFSQPYAQPQAPTPARPPAEKGSIPERPFGTNDLPVEPPPVEPQTTQAKTDWQRPHSLPSLPQSSFEQPPIEQPPLEPPPVEERPSQQAPVGQFGQSPFGQPVIEPPQVGPPPVEPGSHFGEAPGYSDFSIAGPHYSFSSPNSLGFSSRDRFLPQQSGDEPDTTADTSSPTIPPEAATLFGPPPTTPQPAIVTEIIEGVPDLENLDIFDNLEHFSELEAEEIEILEEVIKDDSDQGGNLANSTISGDELRELIKSRIKQASEQLSEPPPEGTPAEGTEKEKSKRATARSKFVGAAKAHEPPKATSFAPRAVPADIRKACLLLGVRPEELTTESIIDAWKRQIASPGVHPDLGGDTESAIYLNTAKDTLIHWLEAQAPKLGKRFGQTVKTKAQSKQKNSAEKAE